MRTKLIWLFVGATFLWGSDALLGASDGAVSMMDYLSYFYGGLLFGTATLAIGMILAIRGVRRGEKLGRAIPLPMLLQLGFLVLVFLGVSFDLAFVTRFKMSRSALQDAAEDIQRGHRRVTPRLGRPF